MSSSQEMASNTRPTELPQEDIRQGWVELTADSESAGGGGQLADSVGTASQSQKKKKQQRCRFFATKRGCRAGEACPYLHDQSNAEPQTMSSNVTSEPKHSDGKLPIQQQQQDQTPVNKEQQDPRTFQINQITRRFQARQETSADDTVVLNFSMRPSDPDFPFDIDALECTLKVPAEFPKERKPVLRVTNKIMERGYQINVERGFDAIWSQASNPTLLNAFKMLDKQLEMLLTAQKAEIVKLVANAGIITGISTSSSVNSKALETAAPVKVTPALTEPVRPIVTAERRAQAQSKRQAEVQILEHRLGRSPQFSKAADDTLFTIPIEPRKRNDLPSTLQAVKAVELLVPLEYDVEPCSIELVGVVGEPANNVSKSFLKRVQENPDATLLAHVNYLAQNIHLMAVAPPRDQIESVETRQPIESEGSKATTDTKDSTIQWARDTDREHVKIIQRPPEWDRNPDEDDGEEEDESPDETDSEFEIYEDDDDEEEEAEEAMHEEEKSFSTPRERGILVSFPDLELHGIELLELILVNITVKCERCKDTSDITKLKPHSEETPAQTLPSDIHSTSCKKCANQFSVAYRKDIMHAHSIRAGYLDLEGCTIVDLLPSTFLPTCAGCSTPAAANGGVVSVRGASSLAICRACHRRMSFSLPQVRFLNIGPSSLHASLPLRPRKPKRETLGIVAGTPLPARGSCTHYAKSYRWFRFSCCDAVYPCDRCHDRATDHSHEFANRMICGWCSREQHYRPDDCIRCRKGVTGRTGHGFWEGGKGTRDRARMSRKDPRKYKRAAGGAAKST